jgi:hypothetical protein
MSGCAHYPIHQFTSGLSAKCALPGFLDYQPFVSALGINENAAFIRSRVFWQDAL